MILERDQIQRYLRHILIPEISGTGQKKLLESSVAVYCEHLGNSAIMLYYLAAMGIGSIHCYSKDTAQQAQVLAHIHALNPDTRISIDASSCIPSFNDRGALIVCLEQEPDFSFPDHLPVVAVAAAGDRGYLRTVKSHAESYSSEIKAFYHTSEEDGHTLFNTAVLGLLSVLSTIEAVKLILNIGSRCEKPLYFNLNSSEYCYGVDTVSQKSIPFNEGLRSKLKSANALIIGSGGLGSPIAYMLSAMGIGALSLVDHDVVELSNLNRQILHDTDKIGMPKVKSAAALLRKLYPDVKVYLYEERFSKENAEALIQNHDIVLDGLDSLPTRYLLNDHCYLAKKPLIEAGVLGFNGLTTALIPESGPCYRCIFPEATGKNPVPS